MEIYSESASVVADVKVCAGNKVNKGDVLVVTELMKMQQEYRAPVPGIVTAVHIKAGDILEAGQRIAVIEPGKIEDQTQIGAGIEQGPVSTRLNELAARLTLTKDTARPKMVENRHARGGRTARENIADLLDDGSFREYGALAVAAQRAKFDDETLEQKSPADGIITGIGSISGVSVAIMVVDYSVMAGTQGYFHHKKLDRILETAERQSLPVIVYAEGGGGRPNDTDAVNIQTAGLDLNSFRAFAKLSGKVPRIAIVHGFCFAGNAALAGTADIIIATKNSWLGMGGPAMIEGGGLGNVSPKEIGPSQVQHANGVIDILVEDEAEATASCKQILAILTKTQNDQETTHTNKPLQELRTIVPENRVMAYKSQSITKLLLDGNAQVELRAAFGIGISTYIGCVDGYCVGVMANNPLYLGGAIDADAADKAAHFMQLCNCFGLPIISLIDTPGFMVGPEMEKQAQVRHVSRMFVTGASIVVPFFSIITRKAYGLGAMAMAGGSLHASDFTIAWPTGEIGPMGLEGAVRLGFKAELEAIENDEKRQERYNELVLELYERGKALSAGSTLEFDAVIDPAETKTWIVSGLKSAGKIAKSGQSFLDVW